MKQRPVLPPLDLRQRYSIAETINYLRVSRAHFHKKLSAGEVEVIEDGRRKFIPGSEIARLSKV